MQCGHHSGGIQGALLAAFDRILKVLTYAVAGIATISLSVMARIFPAFPLKAPL
jgi:hypothetical protein